MDQRHVARWWFGTVLLVLLALMVVAAAPHARAQDPFWGFGISGGYTEMTLRGGDDGDEDLFTDAGGGYVELVIRPTEYVEQGLGVELGFQFTFTTEDIDVVSFDPDLFVEDADAYLSIISVPDVRVTWRQPLADNWFVEPGAGVAFVVALYEADAEVEFFGFEDTETIEDDAGVGLALRPFVRVGYQQDYWSLAVEGAYSYAWIDLDIGDELEQWQVGIVWQVWY